MKKEIFSEAIGKIDTKYINEALRYIKPSRKVLFYKKPVGKTLIAAIFCICFLFS